MKFKNVHFPVLISPVHIPELNVLKETTEGLLIGAACTLTDIETKIKEICKRLPLNKTRTLVAILEMLRWFAGPQIRNVAVRILIFIAIIIVHVVSMLGDWRQHYNSQSNI